MADIDFSGTGPDGVEPARWVHGRKGEPPLQVHRWDPHTVILRQSKQVSFEAPFLYLLFGNRRALLLDTGASSDPQRMPLRSTVDSLLEGWLSDHPRDDYQLLVAHSHGHGDHVAGDSLFQGRPATQIVGRDLASVVEFFGIEPWPVGTADLDLGGRVLEVTGIPGHHPSSLAFFDRWSGMLLTGDTLYPGRLYVPDMAAYRESVGRLMQLAKARPVRSLMGCHIEMTRRPGRDYPLGCRYQPEEPPLAMSIDQLGDLRQAVESVADRPGAHRFADFIIFNGSCKREVLRQLLRLALGRTKQLLTGPH